MYTTITPKPHKPHKYSTTTHNYKTTTTHTYTTTPKKNGYGDGGYGGGYGGHVGGSSYSNFDPADGNYNYNMRVLLLLLQSIMDKEEERK